jgi:hypothetical protein
MKPERTGALVARCRSEHGFSLFELIIAVGIMLAVTAGIFSVMNPAHGTFQAQPEVADMQQRMRVGIDTLSKDLVMAGAGSYSGSQAGSLNNFFAAIMPYRQSGNGAIDDGAVRWKTDAITLMYVPTTFSQTTIRQSMPNASAELKVNAEPGCPSGEDLCGFEEGMVVIIYDDTGAFDTMVITHVQDAALHLQHNQQGPLSKAYDAGAKITQIGQHVYWRNAATNQLMHQNGTTTDAGVAVVDNVVGLNFEYFGDPQPPALKNPGVNQFTTYGPKPPALGVAPGNYWPAGANCTFTIVGAGANAQQVPRLATLGGAAGGLVKLNDPADTATSLTDGPWCPDPNNVNRYDADLLRIRKITVTLRVQTAVAALRGSSTLLFRNPGTVAGASQAIPDHELRFDVTPRNMNLGR